MRRISAKAAAQRQLQDPIVYRVGENATKLEYPRDLPQLVLKKGKTYNPRTEVSEYHSVADYTGTTFHMEQSLHCGATAGVGKH